MKVLKKDILINKYNKIIKIKKYIKNNILSYFVQNNNLNLKEKSVYIFIKSSINIKVKKNTCLFTSRKKGIERVTGISRLKFRKLVKTGSLNNYKIN